MGKMGERSIVSGPAIEAAKAFDVICAGDARCGVEGDAERTLRLLPGGDALAAAVALATQGLRVGLATVIADDRTGRALLDHVTAAGVDVGGVERAQPSSGIIFVATDATGARQIIAPRAEAPPIAVPSSWASRVLLLSGMSPIVEHAGALCRAARAARRRGATVVVDLNARWDQWRGRDPRAIRMVLREADVVWCSAEDLLGMNLDLDALRDALRQGTILGVRDPGGRVWITGPFGELSTPEVARDHRAPREELPFVSVVCAALARAGDRDIRSGELWDDMLRSTSSRKRAGR